MKDVSAEVAELFDRLREEKPWFDKIMSSVERLVINKNEEISELQSKVNKLTVYCGQVETHLAEARAAHKLALDKIESNADYWEKLRLINVNLALEAELAELKKKTLAQIQDL